MTFTEFLNRGSPFFHIFIPLLMLIPALRHHGPQKEVGRPPFLKLGLFEEAEASGRHRRKLSGDVWSRILQRDGDAIKMGPPGDGVSAQPDPVASTSFHGLPAAPPTAGFQKSSGKRVQKSPGKKATLLKNNRPRSTPEAKHQKRHALWRLFQRWQKMRPHPTLSSPTHHAPRSGSLFGKCVEHCGFPANEYNTHSLWVGRATDLALAGTPDHVIRKTGRWSSNAYLNYIRFDVFQLP